METKPGWQTSEFWVTVGSIAGSLIFLLVLFGFIKPQDQASVTKSVTTIIVGVGAVVVAISAAKHYTGARTDLKSDLASIVAALQIKQVEAQTSSNLAEAGRSMVAMIPRSSNTPMSNGTTPTPPG